MEIEIYDKVSPFPSLKNANFFIYWPILMKFDFFEGGGGRGAPYHTFLSQLLLMNI